MRGDCFFPILISLILWPSADPLRAQEEDSKPKPPKLAQITVEGELAEGVENPLGFSVFGGRPKLLQTLLRNIEKARGDAEIQGLVLRIDGPQVGMAKVAAIRRALSDFRASGKKVHVHFDSASTKEYVIAAGADDISMVPSGWLEMPGLRVEIAYMKELLDWLGVKADVIHIGEFKTAFEDLYRNEMSEGQKEALNSILDGFYEEIVRTVSEGRKISADRVKSAVDAGFLTAAQARARGLLDFTEYEDEFRARLERDYGGKLEIVEGYGKKKKPEIDFEDFAAIGQLFGEIFRKPETPKGDKIAVVYAVGMIVSGKSQDSPFWGQVMGSRTMVKAIREAAENREVKAIVLRVDSPGGSGLASDEIWREVVRAKAKKPFVVSMSDVAGSGGYYIAMAADSIVAEEGTITGSIGVIGMKLVLGGLYDKIGMHVQALERGRNAGIFSSASPFSEEQRAIVTKLLESFYHDFVSKAAQGRGRSFEEIDKVARGRIWTGKQAKAIGLVDELGDLRAAIEVAKQKAGIEAGKDLPLLELPRPKSFFELLEEDLPFGFRAEGSLPPGVPGALLLLPQPKRAYAFLGGLLRIQEPALFLIPFQLSWD